MKTRLFLLGAPLLLIGCTQPKEETYDIDVSCPQGAFSYLGEDTVARYQCNESPLNNFVIRCTKESVQIINGVTYCKSIDDNDIRITMTP